MDIFATSTTQNSPSHVAEKNKSSFLINFRRNVGFPVPYEQDGGGGDTTATLCSAGSWTLSSRAVALSPTHSAA